MSFDVARAAAAEYARAAKRHPTLTRAELAQLFWRTHGRVAARLAWQFSGMDSTHNAAIARHSTLAEWWRIELDRPEPWTVD